jgi:uncharacterized protein YkwD
MVVVVVSPAVGRQVRRLAGDCGAESLHRALQEGGQNATWPAAIFLSRPRAQISYLSHCFAPADTALPTLPDLPQAEIAIVEMTNAFRSEHERAAVKPNGALAAAARTFAAYLASTSTFAHEADGRAPATRAAAAGYRYCLVAENLALNVDSRGFDGHQLAHAVVEGWKTSQGHRANLLQPAMTEIGVAVAQVPNAHPKFVTVQLFGRPEHLKVAFAIENRTGLALGYVLGERTLTLGAHTIVTHKSCVPGRLDFGPAVHNMAGHAPASGDRFVVEAGPTGTLGVEVEHH